MTKGGPPVLMLTVERGAGGPQGPQTASQLDKIAGGVFATWAKAGSATVGTRRPTARSRIGGLPASRYQGSITPLGTAATEAVEVAVMRVDDNHIGCLILVGNSSDAGIGALEKAMLAATLTGG